MAAPVTIMPPSSLSPLTLRQVYLRGIDLGPAWHGPSADAALSQLLDFQLSQAETLMNIHFRAWRVLTVPDASQVLGLDFEIPGAVLPFVPLKDGETQYSVALGYHDVQAITQVRLYEGLAGVPPTPVLTPVALDQVGYDRLAERLLVPDVAVTQPDLAQGWAVDYTVGLGRIPDEVAQWVMLHAAIQTLALAGSGEAVTHGLASETLDQDGIVEKNVYAGMTGTALTSGGPYAGAISILQRQLDEIDLPKLRFRYQGSHFLVQPGAGLRPLTDPRI